MAPSSISSSLGPGPTIVVRTWSKQCAGMDAFCPFMPIRDSLPWVLDRREDHCWEVAS